MPLLCFEGSDGARGTRRQQCGSRRSAPPSRMEPRRACALHRIRFWNSPCLRPSGRGRRQERASAFRFCSNLHERRRIETQRLAIGCKPLRCDEVMATLSWGSCSTEWSPVEFRSVESEPRLPKLLPGVPRGLDRYILETDKRAPGGDDGILGASADSSTALTRRRIREDEAGEAEASDRMLRMCARRGCIQKRGEEELLPQLRVSLPPFLRLSLDAYQCSSSAFGSIRR
jgi:hypothetical protein